MDSLKYEYIIGENQHLNYEFFIDNKKNDIAQYYYFYLERNAALRAEFFIMHADVELIVECVLGGHGAQADVVGVYGAHSNNIVRIKTVQHHRAAHTRSSVVMRGIVRDSAQAYYHGTIRVEKKAHGSDASQENKNMVMSNSARVVSEPQLEVLTNDVRCFHGSATSRCDDEQLFYCSARGIDEKKAQHLLLHAFFSGLFVSENLQEKIVELIE